MHQARHNMRTKAAGMLQSQWTGRAGQNCWCLGSQRQGDCLQGWSEGVLEIGTVGNDKVKGMAPEMINHEGHDHRKRQGEVPSYGVLEMVRAGS